MWATTSADRLAPPVCVCVGCLCPALRCAVLVLGSPHCVRESRAVPYLSSSAPATFHLPVGSQVFSSAILYVNVSLETYYLSIDIVSTSVVNNQYLIEHVG